MVWPDRGGSRRPADAVPTPSMSSQHPPPRHAPPTTAHAPSHGRYKSTSRVSEIDVWDNMQNHHLQQGDSSSSDEDIHPRSHPPRPRHTRSMSHPFPSLFSGRKKKSSPTAGKDDDESGPDSAAGSGFLGGKPPPPPTMRGHRNGSSALGSRDFATGRCMTCGSLVRWPRELQMFRCTICLTVNDLPPADRVPGRGGGPEVAVTFEEPPDSKDKPISLSYTKALVEQSLRSFLASVFKNQAGGAVVDQGAPAAPPGFHPDHTIPQERLTTSPLMLRPKSSLNFEPRLTPGPPRGPSQHQHRRGPSWAGTTTSSSSYSTSFPEGRPPLRDLDIPGSGSRRTRSSPSRGEAARRVFRPLEDYIVECFTSFHCLNSSFLIPRSQPPGTHGGESRPRRPSEFTGIRRESRSTSYPVPDLDPKLLLLGNVAENGLWWTGEEAAPGRTLSGRSQNGPSTVSSRNPYIDWAKLEEWYAAVAEAARPWSDIYESLVADDPTLAVAPAALQDIEAQILAGQEHIQRSLLKASETILKRPGRRLTDPQDLRFLLIITANPLLHATYKPYAGKSQPASAAAPRSGASPRGSGATSGRHSVLIKRIVGLMSNAPVECHNHLVGWFARYSEPSFVQTKDLISGFLAYRLIRQNEKKYQTQIDFTGGLIPNMGPSQSPASLHAALGHSQRSNKKHQEKKKVVYQEDWQIKAAAQVLGFLFAANNMAHARRGGGHPDNSSSSSPAGNRHYRELVQAPGQILATSDFYMTLLDDSDLVADFEAWERKQGGRFSFCQHPFLLSVGAKIQILEYDARRQMETKARDAFFDSIMTNRVVQQFLVLSIRRECLVDDSLKAVSEVIGGGGEDIKKGLRINFRGEEGVDAGGLRKEWFLLLVREVFNPDHGMFLYDEDSQYCYFNPHSLEPSEQFFLVGVVLGLAIYNSTILDVALPPFAFRKLLAAAPPPPSPPTPMTPHQPRHPPPTYTLDDLAEYRPRLAHGLRQLLAYPGDDVESVFSLDFAIDSPRYGALDRVPLCPGGAARPVTNANRREYVDAYVRHLLDASVARQFEPFKRGFYTVCSSAAALSLFRAEEIELLVRGSGSDLPLDVGSLKAVAQYDGWLSKEKDKEKEKDREGEDPAEAECTVRWFWAAWEGAAPREQRRLLAFITGSDRVPAMGAASLGIRVSCLGEECGRFPTARTCFNSVGLWRVRGDTAGERERFEGVLWRAVGDSEGFGLK